MTLNNLMAAASQHPVNVAPAAWTAIDVTPTFSTIANLSHVFTPGLTAATIERMPIASGRAARLFQNALMRAELFVKDL